MMHDDLPVPADSARPYPTLFSPLDVGSFRLRNRIVSTSHDAHFAVNGVPTDRYARYLESKSAGGAALIQAFGSTSVDPNSPPVPGIVCNWDDSVIPPLADVAERVHAHGALITCQLVHHGRWTPAFITHSAALAPSDLPHERFGAVPRVMTAKDICAAIDAYAVAAARCVRAGMDGVEIALFADMLPDQFLSPTINDRTDAYGGSFDNRVRFSVELLQAVRASIGDEALLVARIAADDLDPGGLTREERLAVASRFDELGVVDLFSVVAGTIRGLSGRSQHIPSSYVPRAAFVDGARAVKEVVRAPVLYTGRVVEPQEAEQVVASTADLVGMTRALIADPELPNKARRGRLAEIRLCTGANEGCAGRLYRGMDIECVQNPMVGREAELGGPLVATEQPKTVVVAGGGPGGLETARVAALRGHRVVLMEQSERLGGRVLTASRAPGRGEYAGIADWLTRQVERTDVDIRLKTTATAGEIAAERPDVVVVATGSVARSSGCVLADTQVATAVDVLDGVVTVGNRALVLAEDPFIEGPTTADFLVSRGHEVALTTPHYTVGESVDDTLKPVLLGRLHKAGVAMYPLHEVSAVHRGLVKARHMFSGVETEFVVDTVVTSAGRHAANSLFTELTDVHVHTIGDAFAPRGVHEAILEASRLGREL